MDAIFLKLNLSEFWKFVTIITINSHRLQRQQDAFLAPRRAVPLSLRRWCKQSFPLGCIVYATTIHIPLPLAIWGRVQVRLVLVFFFAGGKSMLVRC